MPGPNQTSHDADVAAAVAAQDKEITAPTENDRLLDVDNESPITDIDDAMRRCGIGRFQAYMAFTTGLCSMADAMEVTLLAFLRSCLSSAWDLSYFTSDAIISCVFLGELFGALCFGPMSDLFGRKRTSVAGMLTTGICGMLSATTTSAPPFIALRTLTGFGIGSSCVPYDTPGLSTSSSVG
jgi:MFS family permease